MRIGLFAALLLSSLLTCCARQQEQVAEYVSRAPAVLPNPKILKVMVIDTGIDCHNKELTKYTKAEYCAPRYVGNIELIAKHQDTNSHGSHVTGIIASKACKGVEIIPCKFYESSDLGMDNLNREVECINKAAEQGVNIINLSGGGNQPSSSERVAVEAFLRTGGSLIAAAGNDGHSLDLIPYYPACYRRPGVVAVGSLDHSGKPLPSSNYAPWIKWRLGLTVESWLLDNRRGYMSGTSQACAVYTSELVEQWCKAH